MRQLSKSVAKSRSEFMAAIRRVCSEFEQGADAFNCMAVVLREMKTYDSHTPEKKEIKFHGR